MGAGKEKIRFECSCCGKCCGYRPDVKHTQELGPDYWLKRYSPPYSSGISLFKHEKERFARLAKERGLKIDFVPGTFFVKNGKIVVYRWKIKNKACPFQGKDKKCTIYKDRALICRMYPVLAVYTGEEAELTFSSACPAYAALPEEAYKALDKGELEATVEQVFGKETLDAVKEFVGIHHGMGKAMKALVQAGVRPDRLSAKETLKLLEAKSPVDFLDYCCAVGVLSKKG